MNFRNKNAFTSPENAADFSRRSSPIEADGGIPPKAQEPPAEGEARLWRLVEKSPSAPLDSKYLTASAWTVSPTRHKSLNGARERSSLVGFTLIEMIVVLAIIGLTVGMSIPYFARFSKGAKLKSATTNISAILQTARSYAITERRNFLVVINDKVEGDLYYALKIYRIGDEAATVGKWYQLPQGIEIDSLTFHKKYAVASVPFPNDSDAPQTKTVVEYKPNGAAKYSGSIYIKDKEKNYKRITVDNITGRVKVTNEGPE